MGLVDSIGNSIFNFLGAVIAFSTVAGPFYIATNRAQDSSFSVPLPTLVILFFDSLPNRCEVSLTVGLIRISQMLGDAVCLFMCSLAFAYLFWEKMCIQALCAVLNPVFNELSQGIVFRGSCNSHSLLLHPTSSQGLAGWPRCPHGTSAQGPCGKFKQRQRNMIRKSLPSHACWVPHKYSCASSNIAG